MNKSIRNKKKSRLLIRSISKVNLTKDDVIVIHSDHVMSGRDMEDAKIYINKVFPNNQVMLLNKGFKFSVVKQKEEKII